MATFKNETGKSTITGTTLYTTPTNVKSVVLSVNVTNLVGTSETISLMVGDAFIAKDIPLPTGSSLELISNKLVLEGSQTLKIMSLDDNSVDVFVSMMEA